MCIYLTLTDVLSPILVNFTHPHNPPNTTHNSLHTKKLLRFLHRHNIVSPELWQSIFDFALEVSVHVPSFYIKLRNG